MKRLGSLPWSQVQPGMVVLLEGVPRTVLIADSWHTFMVEGAPPIYPEYGAMAELVLLDDADAVATLAAAGLNPEIIETEETHPS